MNVEFPAQALDTATRLLKLMSNASRLLVLCELLDGEKSVSELERLTSLSQSALSQHLAKLRSHRLVATRRQSQNIFYSLADTDVDQIIALLHRLFCKAQPKERRRGKAKDTMKRIVVSGAGPGGLPIAAGSQNRHQNKEKELYGHR